jgi:D-proline reductase (dithiol) PrdB
MTVNSFKYLPRLIATFYQMTEREAEYPIPWTPLPGSLESCTIGLVTSGGLYHRGIEAPFDLQREIDEPTWGDPTYRTIPQDISQSEVGASHLHINTRWVEKDINVLLPIDRFQELVVEGVVGRLAMYAYSFMGYQGFPPNPAAWRETYGPQVAGKLKEDGVDCVLLTPS